MKYALKQVVFYMKDNKLHGSEIFSRMVIENAYEEKARTSQQWDTYCRFGAEGIFYWTIHGRFAESEVFESKEALAAALIAS